MRKNNMAKLTEDFIKYEDMFIGEKVVSRNELLEKLNISNKKLRGIGSYSYFLEKFNLKNPSTYYYDNKEKEGKLLEFVNDFYYKKDRLPMVKEIPSKICGREFINRTLGGYKNFLGSNGFSHVKPITQAKTFDIDKNKIILNFKKVYKNPPIIKQLIIDYSEGKVEYSYAMIKTIFGSYSDFLIECEYPIINSNMYSSLKISKDGHKCDSYSEMMVDDFMYENNIKHTSHQMYRFYIDDYNGKYTSDFILSDGTIVEYFGLKGQLLYDKKTIKKLKLLNDNNINYIAIYPEDLKDLKTIFKNYIKEDK